LAGTVGAETATLAETNLPSHTHTASVGTESVTHTHTGTSGGESTNHNHYFSHTAGTSGSYGLFDSATASSSGQPSTGGIQQNHTHATTTGTESANHNHSVSNSNTGSGTAFGIMPPSIVVNFIIKI
jgi:microcystin-dependent protein